jgi:uncharacterized membrane protein YhaH (DUF805 family)
MYCKHCGKKIDKESKFCIYCGNKLKGAETEIISDKIAQHFDQKDNFKETNIISNYFNVRASRQEYWMFFLVNFIIVLGLGFFEGLIGIYPESEESVFASIYQLSVLLPSLAVGVRRMHDINESGWFILIPILNFFATLRKGDTEVNSYGVPPNY